MAQFFCCHGAKAIPPVSRNNDLLTLLAFSIDLCPGENPKLINLCSTCLVGCTHFVADLSPASERQFDQKTCNRKRQTRESKRETRKLPGSKTHTKRPLMRPVETSWSPNHIPGTPGSASPRQTFCAGQP